MSQHTVPVAAITGAVVSPYRFSQQPAAMIEFLGLIGLSVTVRRHDYAILQGKGGRVAVHPVATAGNPEVRTSLTFEVPDAVAATEQLTKAGLEASWWDEAWGRQARVSGPTGQISLNAEMEDFHGYQVSDPGPSPVTVVAVVFTDEMDVLTDFFGRFGFTRGGDEAPGWRPLRAEVGQGVIGVHQAGRPGLDTDGYLTAPLGFETDEPLGELAERLRAAGHPVESCTAGTEPPTDILSVIDPDGQTIEIHPAR